MLQSSQNELLVIGKFVKKIIMIIIMNIASESVDVKYAEYEYVFFNLVNLYPS